MAKEKEFNLELDVSRSVLILMITSSIYSDIDWVYQIGITCLWISSIVALFGVVIGFDRINEESTDNLLSNCFNGISLIGIFLSLYFTDSYYTSLLYFGSWSLLRFINFYKKWED